MTHYGPAAEVLLGAVAIMLLGPGEWSLEGVFRRKRRA
jgi:hypothetical protein